jgi:fibro-slime domain-containing protein
MKNKSMKRTYSSIKSMVFGLVLLLMGMGGAYAAMPCEGTVYFKIPSTWTSAYTVAGGHKTEFTPSSYTGWSQVSTSAIGGAYAANEFFIEQTGQNNCYSGKCVRRDSMDVMYLNISTGPGFKCTDFGTTGELWISENPDPAYPNVPYFNSVAPDVKYFYVFLPDEAVWKSAVPMMSSDGGPGEALTADPDRCGWYFKRYIDEPLPSSVVIYRDDDPTKEDAIGLNGLWDEDGIADPIPLATYFALYALYGVNDLYFIPDDNLWPDEGASLGWYDVDPMVDGSCSYNLAAIIYDTDASMHGAFTCAPNWMSGQTPAEAAANACYYPTAKYNVVSSATGQVPCIGVTTGIVDSILGADGKPVYNAASGCFPNGGFTELFKYTPNVNATYCYDLPFSRSKDGQWEFNSDTYQSPGAPVPGGFYPAETTPTATLISPALPAAETKRKAEGPVFLCKGLRELDPTEGVPVIDVFCKGPGWNRADAVDCEGLFKGGSEFTPAAYPSLGLAEGQDGWGWSCPNNAPIGWPKYVKGTETPSATPSADNRWTSTATGVSGGRNQHFCFESHASFTYKPGLRFSFRGDDDIWVFIGGKLAVDIGGTHIAAPGYVNLDQITDKDGLPLVVGTTYPIDIFFCDRRTTMSNVRIKTNMYIQQKTGITYNVTKLTEGKGYELCWNESGEGSCTAALGGTSGSVEYCGNDIIKTGKQINYTLTRRDGSIVPGGDVADLAAPGVYFGGIDLTNRHTPIINVENIEGLSSDESYKLLMTIENKSTYIIFRVRSSTSIEEMKSSASTISSSHKLVVRNNKVELQKKTNTGKMIYYNLHGSRVK